MKHILSILVLCLSACGGEDPSPPVSGSTGGSPSAQGSGGSQQGGSQSSLGGSASGGAPTVPQCKTVTVQNSTAAEKVNAAFCFGIAYSDSYSCTTNSTGSETDCMGLSTSYYVLWTGTAYGDVYDGSNDAHLAVISQEATGPFRIEWDASQVGECTVNGDIATLCV